LYFYCRSNGIYIYIYIEEEEEEEEGLALV
jgi:hypothetical protein